MQSYGVCWLDFRRFTSVGASIVREGVPKTVKLAFALYSSQSFGKQQVKDLVVKVGFFFCYLLTAISHVAAQEQKDTSYVAIQFMGTISLTTNGISPIPAFSLEKPAILAFLSVRKNKFSYDPEMAFSIKGVPWFFNNNFRYRVVEKPSFEFRTGLIWGIGYLYPEVMLSGVKQRIAKAERFLWLELLPRYKVSEKVAISSTLWSGYNFETGSAKRINYVSLVGHITKIPLSQSFYCNFFPQLFYLKIDSQSDGFFVSGIAAIGHNKFPLLISSQMNTTLTTTISPNPGFKWNISLAYSFK